MNKIMLWGITVMAVVFVFFPQHIMGFILPSVNHEVTDDMEQTVLRVEGIT